jgi:hypothetical protein
VTAPRALRPRSVSVLAGLAVGVAGLVILVASIESLGLVGDADTEMSWPLAAVGLGMLAVAPAGAAWVRHRSWSARHVGVAAVGGVVVAAVAGALSGSMALAVLGWFVVGVGLAVR